MPGPRYRLRCALMSLTSCWSPRRGWPTPVSVGGCSMSWPDGSGCWSSTRPTRCPTGGMTSGPTTGGAPTSCGRSIRRLRCWAPRQPPTRGGPWTARVSSAGATLVLRGPLARGSLQLTVVDALSPIERFAWVVDHLPRLEGSGIVYTLTVADAERLAAAVQFVHGDSCRGAAYTGGLESSERERLEDALHGNRLKALIATSALGMGYDKPDLGFVVHVGSPPSPVSYYQQVGRAGRGIDHALVTLLPSDADAGVWNYFATATIPDRAQVERLLAGLSAYDGDQPATVAALEAETGLRRGRVELMLKQLAVDGAVERVQGGWHPTGAQWVYDQAHYDAIIATRRREADIMRAYTRGQRCLMQLLQESLDDPSAQPCGRCSVCLGHLPQPLQGRPEPGTVEAGTRRLRGEVTVLEPRKMWPGGAFGTRGRIPPGLMAQTGRAIVYADAPEWRELVASTFARDSPPTQELCNAAVAALGHWRDSWPSRPEVVVSLPASGFPVMTGGLADHLAVVGQLGRADLRVAIDSGAPDDLSSPQEAALWWDSICVTDELARAVQGKVVLLVVDASSSQWPITVAAGHLRQGKASMVLPLLVHRRPWASDAGRLAGAGCSLAGGSEAPPCQTHGRCPPRRRGSRAPDSMS